MMLWKRDIYRMLNNDFFENNLNEELKPLIEEYKKVYNELDFECFIDFKKENEMRNEIVNLIKNNKFYKMDYYLSRELEEFPQILRVYCEYARK